MKRSTRCALLALSLASLGCRSVLGLGDVEDLGEAPIVRTFGGPGSEEAVDAALAGDGSVLILGTLDSDVDFGGGLLSATVDNPLFVLKLDANLDHAWSVLIEGDGLEGRAIDVDSQGNVLVAGNVDDDLVVNGEETPHSSGSGRGFVLKLSPDGSLLWHWQLEFAVDQIAGAQHEIHSMSVNTRTDAAIVGGFCVGCQFNCGEPTKPVPKGKRSMGVVVIAPTDLESKSGNCDRWFVGEVTNGIIGIQAIRLNQDTSTMLLRGPSKNKADLASTSIQNWVVNGTVDEDRQAIFDDDDEGPATKRPTSMATGSKRWIAVSATVDHSSTFALSDQMPAVSVTDGLHAVVLAYDHSLSFQWAVSVRATVLGAPIVIIAPSLDFLVAGAYTDVGTIGPVTKETALVPAGAAHRVFLTTLGRGNGAPTSLRTFGLEAGDVVGLGLQQSGHAIVTGWFSGAIDEAIGTATSRGKKDLFVIKTTP